MTRAWPPLPADWAGAPDNQVDCVCVLAPGAGETKLRQLGRILPRDDRMAAERFHRPEDQILFAAARASLRYLVGRSGQLDPHCLVFHRTAFGKPFLPNGPHFNLSHAGDKILIGVATNAPVGVDIEPQRSASAWREVLTELHHAEQTSILCAASPELAFLRVWTRKEAVAKADGRGLSANFRAWPVCQPQPGSLVVIAGEPDSEWQVFDLDPGEGYVAAMATRVGLGMRCWTVSWERIIEALEPV